MRFRFVVLGLSAMGTAAWSGACGGSIETDASGTTTATATSSVTTAGTGSGATSSSSSGGSGGGTGSGGGGLASPPPPGPPHAPDGTGTTVLAVSQLYVGETDPDGTPDEQNGWTHYGYNIDGVPPSDLSAFCLPAGGAKPAQVHQHGAGGIENGFGHNILPMLICTEGVCPIGGFSHGIDTGDYTTLVLLSGLGQGSSYDPLPSSVAQAGDLGAKPKLDGTDAWPIVSGSTMGFASPYVVGDIWVSGASLQSATGALVVQITVSSGIDLPLKILLPRITMKLDPTHTKATSGVISGVLLTSDLMATVEALEYEYEPDLPCDGPTIKSILQAIAQASDILHDGTQDPTKPCDAISIGLGFDAVRAQIGPAVPPPPMPVDPCGN